MENWYKIKTGTNLIEVIFAGGAFIALVVCPIVLVILLIYRCYEWLMKY